jgi:hypothetical protein
MCQQSDGTISGVLAEGHDGSTITGLKSDGTICGVLTKDRDSATAMDGGSADNAGAVICPHDRRD